LLVFHILIASAQSFPDMDAGSTIERCRRILPVILSIGDCRSIVGGITIAGEPYSDAFGVVGDDEDDDVEVEPFISTPPSGFCCDPGSAEGCRRLLCTLDDSPEPTDDLVCGTLETLFLLVMVSHVEAILVGNAGTGGGSDVSEDMMASALPLRACLSSGVAVGVTTG
jgi:hypothetical protein